MPTGEPESPFPIRNRDVSGGVNNKLFGTDIADNEAVQLKNLRTDVLGIRQTRHGSSIAATGITFGPVVALREFADQNGADVVLAVAPGGSLGDNMRLYKWDGTSTFSFVGAMTGYTGGLGDDYSIVNAREFENPPGGGSHVAIISNSVGNSVPRFYYDGATLAATDWPDTNNTAVFAHAVFGARILASGTKKYQSSLFYGNVALAVTTATIGAVFTTSTDFFKFGGTNDNTVVAVEVLRQNVVVFMESRFDVLDTSYKGFSLSDGTADTTPGSNWAVVAGHEAIGCGSRKSIANSGEDLFFADQYGNIRSLARTISDAGSGVSTLPVSDPIQGWIDRINPTAISTIVAHVYNRWLVVGLPIDNSATPDHVFVMDLVRSRQMGRPVWDGPWMSSDNRAFRPQAMATAALTSATVTADQAPTLYVAATVSTNYVSPGLVYRLFRGTDDDGNAIEAQEVTKRITGDTLELLKAWEREQVFLVGSGAATMHVEANLDNTGWEHLGYVSLLGDAPVLPVDLPFTLGGAGIVSETLATENLSKQKSRDISFRYTVTSTVQLKMLGHTVYGYMENWDRTPGSG